jgi:multidrug efflux pump subunit AcrA (membrane-fusion protein)
MKKTLIISPARFTIFCLMTAISALLFSCKGGADKAADDDDAAVKAQTPVTITSVNDSSMVDYIDLNATSSFLQKSYVKANANGYIQKVNAELGHFVNNGTVLFTIKTKEAQSIGNSINILDTTFKFSGENKIKANQHGYLTQLNHQAGDYVQDGDQLAIISDRSSFVFLLQLPYELRAYVHNGQSVQLTLPDGTKMAALATSSMPSVDTVAQTQSIVLKVNSDKPIPENLVAKARIVKSAKSNTSSLPKSAILSNETQTEFWVMKLINPTTAVKTLVKKGIEAGDRVEILSPKFTAQDKIVVTGNYGLADTAKVKIVQ